MHGSKPLRVLPDYTVVHKQDFFIEERYMAPEEGSERSFLARSYERHFNERPYLRHTCYLFVTKTTPERMRQTSASSVLCRGLHRPAGDARHGCRDALSGGRGADGTHPERFGPRARRAAYGSGDRRHGGRRRLLARYFALSDEQRPVVNEDIRLDPDVMRIGDKYLSMHTLSDLDMLPQSVATDFRYERLDRPLGLPPLVRGARGAAALLQPCLQSGDLPRRPRRNAQASRSLGPEHELAGGLFALERHQPGVDRNVSQ